MLPGISMCSPMVGIEGRHGPDRDCSRSPAANNSCAISGAWSASAIRPRHAQRPDVPGDCAVRVDPAGRPSVAEGAAGYGRLRVGRPTMTKLDRPSRPQFDETRRFIGQRAIDIRRRRRCVRRAGAGSHRHLAPQAPGAPGLAGGKISKPVHSVGKISLFVQIIQPLDPRLV